MSRVESPRKLSRARIQTRPRSLLDEIREHLSEQAERAAAERRRLLEDEALRLRQRQRRRRMLAHVLLLVLLILALALSMAWIFQAVRLYLPLLLPRLFLF